MYAILLVILPVVRIMVAGDGIDGDSGIIPGTGIRVPFTPAVPRVDKVPGDDDRRDITGFFE
jgi:hypothetical protein